MLEYIVLKQKGSSQYCVFRSGEEKTPLSKPYPTKKKAMHKAAELEGIDYKQYTTIRRKECAAGD